MSGSVSRRGRTPLLVISILAYVYLFAPILWIVVFSFNRPRGKYNLQWREFTLDNWANPFKDVQLTDAFQRSLIVAAVSVAIATAAGAAIALALAKYRFRGNSAVDVFLVLPLTTPEIVLGASLLNLFIDPLDMDRGMVTIIIAHTVFCMSFVAMTVKARIRGFDWRLEEAAADLGANPWSTFRRVTFPLILPGVFAAALLSFALSIDDYIITSFVKGSTNTMPVHIWDSFKVEFRPHVNVLATMILLVSTFLLVGSTIMSGRRER